MTALTKSEMADRLHERLGLNKRESKDMVEAFFELVNDTLVRGTDVKLSGFGNFQIRRKAPRPGRNPRTGEIIYVPARRKTHFKPGRLLKDALHEVRGSEDDSAEGVSPDVERIVPEHS